MIAAYAVIFVLSMAMSWRGYRFIAFCKRMGWKLLAATIVSTLIVVAGTGALETIILTPLTFALLSLIALAGFTMGAMARVILRRRHGGAEA